MAVVTSSFNITTSTAWASSSWVSSDPSYKLDVQLQNWVSAINDTSIIEILQTPGSATARGTSDTVRWMLRARAAGDTASDYGIIFAARPAGTGTTSNSEQIYFARTSGSANNNYGTYTANGTSTSNEDLTVAGNFITAYEATGTTPWFVYSWENSTKTTRHTRMLLRYDNSALVAGSYDPTGVGKWIYFNRLSFRVPITNTSATYRGFGADTGPYLLRSPIPTTTYGDGYFFRLGSQYAANHALGVVTSDILVSNTATGLWGDTATIDSKTYTCLGNNNSLNYWVKTA